MQTQCSVQKWRVVFSSINRLKWSIGELATLAACLDGPVSPMTYILYVSLLRESSRAVCIVIFHYGGLRLTNKAFYFTLVIVVPGKKLCRYPKLKWPTSKNK